MAYTRYYPNGWKSGEVGATPITPAALNNMEAGIEAANAIGDPVTIAHGGTGGATAAAARTKLSVYSKAETNSAISQSIADEIVTQEYEQVVEAFDAGNAGSRAAQYSINVAKSGYTPIAVSLLTIINSVVINQQVAFNTIKTGVYLNLYRASGAAYAGGGSVRFIVVYQKN